MADFIMSMVSLGVSITALVLAWQAKRHSRIYLGKALYVPKSKTKWKITLG